MYQRSFEDLQRDVATAINFLPSEGVPQLTDVHAMYQDALRACYIIPKHAEVECVWTKTAILYGLALTSGKRPDWNGFVLRVDVNPLPNEEVFQPKTQLVARFYALLLVNIAIGCSVCSLPEYRRYGGYLGERALIYFEDIGNPARLNRWIAAAYLAQACAARYTDQENMAKNLGEQALSLLPSVTPGLLSLAQSFTNESEAHHPAGLRRFWRKTTEPSFTAEDLYCFND